MKEASLGHKAAAGAVWATVDRFGTMILQFVVNLVLARLLIPADFGAIGMLAIFIAVSQTLIDGGFGSALIQKKNPTQVDFSTVFFWNLGFSLLLYCILFLFAPLIGKFYSMPILSDVLRVIGISLVINSVLTIQTTRLRKQLAFRTIAITNLGAYVAGAVMAISMAKSGFGVWSLVAMQLCQGGIAVLILWLNTHWHPSYCFSKKTMKELFGFGGYIMAANIFQTICQNLQGIIIGKRFSATQMGYFSQAYKLDQITSYSIPQVIVQVMYPVYSSIQDDKERLKNMVLMNLRVVAFIIFPILATLILIAEPLIVFLYGEKWLPSVPYFRILCVGGFFVCLQNINFYAVAAVGKSKSLFKWSFYKWGFLLAALLIGMEFGMYGILWGMVLSSANIFFTNAYLAQKHTGLSVIKQFGNVVPILIITFICICVGWECNHIFSMPFISGILIIVLYLCISAFLHLEAFRDARSIVQKLVNRK